MAKESLRVSTEPRTIWCSVGKEVKVETAIENRSETGFRVSELSQNPDDDVKPVQPFLLAPHARTVLRTPMGWKSPGRFAIPPVKIILLSHGKAFRESISLHGGAFAIVRPPAYTPRLGSVDLSGLLDLTSDPVRRGPGTDLAGIKPAGVFDDLHRIDWKATARTGQLMVKEFSLEKQPTVMLLIDASMKRTSGGSTFNALVAALPDLMASLGDDTPIGLILFSEDSVVKYIPARLGEHQKQTILRALLESKVPDVTPTNTAPESPELTSPEIYQFQRRFDRAFTKISMFYKDISTRRQERFRAQGAFMAFQSALMTPGQTLMIALTDGRSNMKGLIDGARTATISKHRVIIALLSEHGKGRTDHRVPELKAGRIEMRTCSPGELPLIMETEIGRLSRERFISTVVEPKYKQPDRTPSVR